MCGTVKSKKKKKKKKKKKRESSVVIAMALVTTVAEVQSLAWKLPHAMGTAKKLKKKKKVLNDQIEILEQEFPSWHSG